MVLEASGCVGCFLVDGARLSFLSAGGLICGPSRVTECLSQKECADDVVVPNLRGAGHPTSCAPVVGVETASLLT